VPGLVERVPAVGSARVLSEGEPGPWRPEAETEVFVAPNGFAEAVLFHPASATLVVTDLAFDVVSFPMAADRFFWRAFGVPAGLGPSRTARWTLLRDREAARPFLRRILEWPFERIVVGHGDPVERDARAAFRRAFAATLG
jgi:hypothetical protein